MNRFQNHVNLSGKKLSGSGRAGLGPKFQFLLRAGPGPNLKNPARADLCSSDMKIVDEIFGTAYSKFLNSFLFSFVLI